MSKVTVFLTEVLDVLDMAVSSDTNNVTNASLSFKLRFGRNLWVTIFQA